MEVFLTQQVEKLGKAGERVRVRDGFARNFLIPKKWAVSVTEGAQKQVEEQKKHLLLGLSRQEKRAQELKEKLENIHLTIPVQAGKDEKIFGSVTNQTIEKALKEQGISLNRRWIHLDEPIHKLGSYTLPVKLGAKIDASLKLTVVKLVAQKGQV